MRGTHLCHGCNSSYKVNSESFVKTMPDGHNILQSNHCIPTTGRSNKLSGSCHGLCCKKHGEARKGGNPKRFNTSEIRVLVQKSHTFLSAHKTLLQNIPPPSELPLHHHPSSFFLPLHHTFSIPSPPYTQLTSFPLNSFHLTPQWYSHLFLASPAWAETGS